MSERSRHSFKKTGVLVAVLCFMTQWHASRSRRTRKKFAAERFLDSILVSLAHTVKLL
jgi:hypothetical protein